MSSGTQPPGILSFEKARHVVEQHAAQLSAVKMETIDLLAAAGRVLAEPILADRDFPPFHRATRDGYAVRAEDVATVPTRLEIIGEIKAGDPARPDSVKPRQALSIMTGAPLPPGADAVVMVEYTKQSDSSVEVLRPVAAGENFVSRGSEATQGRLLLDRGTRLDPAAISVAAACGKDKLQVFRKPRAAVLATGDELVEVNASPGAAQIRNSNSYSMAAQVVLAGAEPVVLRIAPDERRQLRALIEEGLQSDLLLLTGGVSMGKYDLVEQVLSDLQAEFYFTGAQIQPGRPVVFGSCPCGAGASTPETAGAGLETRAGAPAPHRKYFFGLPGNPVSTMLTFELFARPIIEALAGLRPRPLTFLKARLKSEIQTKTGLTRFLPARLSGEFDSAEVELVRWQGSGDIAALTVANCYLVIPPDRERLAAGEWASLLLR